MPLDVQGRFGGSIPLARALGLQVAGPFYEAAGPGSPSVGVVASPPRPVCATEKFGVLALGEHLKEVGWPVRFVPCARGWD